MRLCPERHVARIPSRCAFWVVQFDQSRLHAVPDDPRYGFGFLLKEFETLPKALVRHLLVHDVTQAAVLIASPDPIVAVHLIEWPVAVENCYSPALTHPEVWRRKLVDLGGIHHLVDSAPLFFPKPPPAALGRGAARFVTDTHR